MRTLWKQTDKYIFEKKIYKIYQLYVIYARENITSCLHFMCMYKCEYVCVRERETESICECVTVWYECNCAMVCMCDD